MRTGFRAESRRECSAICYVEIALALQDKINLLDTNAPVALPVPTGAFVFEIIMNSKRLNNAVRRFNAQQQRFEKLLRSKRGIIR